MKKLFYSIMLLALVGVFSACKEEKEEPKETPKPDPTYSVTFWTNDCDDIVVNLYNDEDYDKEKTITEKYSSTPDCGSKGCANFSDLKKGEYSYYAYNDDYWWKGYIDVTETCEKIKLSTSNGESFVKYGDVTFWTNDCDDIVVNLYNDEDYDKEKTITEKYSSTPDCGAKGCANFSDLKKGEYYYYAYNDDYWWEGYIDVTETCETIKLSTSNGEKYVDFTFWTDYDYGHGTYTVKLWNNDDYDKTYTVTRYYATTPDCGADGCANFKSLEPGTYSYYATTQDEMYYWEDEVTLTKECHTMLLYISDAKFNSNAQPREVSKLEAGSMDFDMNNILK